MARKKSNRSDLKGFQSRRVNQRELAYSFLIVCEGSKTEPDYFDAFPAPRYVLRLDVLPGGGSPCAIVETAKERQEQERRKGLPFDQVWCVFDRDDVDEEQFRKAIRDADRLGFRVAYTNQAFDLWYLLHFDYYNTGIDRSSYKQRLTNRLGYEYRKNAPGMYATLVSRQQTAIRFAERLLKEYEPADPANDNPSTTVHLLVKELIKHSHSR